MTMIAATQAAVEATATAHHLAIVMIAQKTTVTEVTAIEATDEMTAETTEGMITEAMTALDPHEKKTRTSQRSMIVRSRARRRRKRRLLRLHLHLRR